jgi:hypothetical protein
VLISTTPPSQADSELIYPQKVNINGVAGKAIELVVASNWSFTVIRFDVKNELGALWL